MKNIWNRPLKQPRWLTFLITMWFGMICYGTGSKENIWIFIGIVLLIVFVTYGMSYPVSEMILGEPIKKKEIP